MVSILIGILKRFVSIEKNLLLLYWENLLTLKMEYGIIAQLSLQYKLLLQTINDHTLTRVHFTYKPKHNWNRQLKTPSIQIPYKTITYIFTDGHGQNTQHPWLQPAPLWAWLESAFSTIKQRPSHFLEQWLNGLRQGLYPKGTSIWPLLIDKNIYTSYFQIWTYIAK